MFSATAEYALRAMATLALYPDERVSAGAIAERTQVPSDYLSKVLQQLATAGLISGRRGVGGGYQLAKAPSEIRIMDAVQAVTPIERIAECPLGIETHGPNLCPLHRMIDEAAGAVITILEQYTLDDVINEPGANTPLCEVHPSNGVDLRIDR